MRIPVFAYATCASVLLSVAPSAFSPRLESVVANDNLVAAGASQSGVWTLNLRVAEGLWRPEGEAGPARRIEAFGEEGQQLSTPAPLIRVPLGMTIVARVNNNLARPLTVHGFCTRGGSACEPLKIAAGDVREVRFTAATAGTYHYWGSTSGMPARFRAAEDTQLSGAFIVDDPGAFAPDRVLVITEWTSLSTADLHALVAQDDPGTAFLARRPDILFTINGRAWPHTERLRYDLGERVRWRVINLSTQVHPMHLHGFYFDVHSVGDGAVDRPIAAGQQPKVVTQLMSPGSTMEMSWVAERVGRWLFHCHVMTHVSPYLYVDGSPKPHAGHAHDHQHADGPNNGVGMTGMVLGITIADASGSADGLKPEALPTVAPRRLALTMRQDAGRFGDAPALGFVQEDIVSRKHEVSVPGPTLVLKRGEPVEITLRNELPEATAIHWHGMELESFYDGVHGFGGAGNAITPMVASGASFVVRFTPPRTGTFIYHTHLHDKRQLTSGLYGALLVVEADGSFDASSDHVLVIGRGGPAHDAPVVINNDRTATMAWTAARRHRIRLINITPDDIVSVSLRSGAEQLMAWQPLTKDGADVPPALSQPRPATQTIGVGETYDFAVDLLPGRQTLWLEVRSPGGRWLTQAQVIVR